MAAAGPPDWQTIMVEVETDCDAATTDALSVAEAQGLRLDVKELIVAARTQDMPKLRTLLDGMKSFMTELVNVRSMPGGWTALHTAAYQGNVKALQLLVDSGAKVSLRTPAGYTALQYAHRKGHEEAESFLLSAFEVEIRVALARKQQEQATVAGRQ